MMPQILHRITISLALFVVVLTVGATAKADVVYLGPLTANGSGLGAVTTILTIQGATGNSTFERGCVGRAGGADVTCSQDEKTGAGQTLTRTLLELGVTQGSQLRIVFNIDETNSTATSRLVTLQRLEITIWNGDSLVGTFVCSNCADSDHLTLLQDDGVGGSGHVFGLDAIQAAQLQTLINTYGTGLRVGITASVGCEGTENANCRGIDNGPETFYGTNVAAAVPEPASMLLLGSGLVGLAAGVRRRMRKQND